MQSPVYKGVVLQKIVSKVGTWSTFSPRNKVIYGGLIEASMPGLVHPVKHLKSSPALLPYLPLLLGHLPHSGIVFGKIKF